MRAIAPLLLVGVAAVLFLVPRGEPAPPRSEGERVSPPRPERNAPEPTLPLLRGRVVTEGTRAPVEGARVIVDQRFVRTTDVDGAFEVPRTPEATHASFRITHARHRSWRTTQPIGDGEIELALVPGLSLDGVVVTTTGEPVPGIRIDVGESEAWTADDGRFRSGGHQPGALTLRCRGCEVGARGGETDVRLVVEGSYLFVRTFDEEGAPVRGARHAASGAYGVAGGDAWSDYTLFERETGKVVRIDFTRDGYLPARLEWAPRSRDVGADREVVVMRARPPNSLAIEVRNADGSFPSAAHFAMRDGEDLPLVYEEVALVAGRGRVRGLPEGRYVARVWGDKDYALGVEVGVRIDRGDDNKARFELRPGARVCVRWTQYASRYRLELRPEPDTEDRYTFGKYAGKELWGTTTRVPAGWYRLYEMRAHEVVREGPGRYVGTETVLLDWLDDEIEWIDWSEDE